MAARLWNTAVVFGHSAVSPREIFAATSSAPTDSTSSDAGATAPQQLTNHAESRIALSLGRSGGHDAKAKARGDVTARVDHRRLPETRCTLDHDRAGRMRGAGENRPELGQEVAALQETIAADSVCSVRRPRALTPFRLRGGHRNRQPTGSCERRPRRRRAPRPFCPSVVITRSASPCWSTGGRLDGDRRRPAALRSSSATS